MTRRRMASLAARLVLLGVGGAAVAASVSASPATNEALRVPGPFGDWRQVPSAALYDAGDYYFELGYDYVLALSQVAYAAAQGEALSPRDRAALIEGARQLLQEALRRSPADAQAWAALALVSAIQGDEAMKARALRRSWELAPYNDAISRLRIMTLAAATPDDPGPEIRDAIRRDLEVMRQRQQRNLQQLLQAAPRLGALISHLEDDPATRAL